jgi:hypothetical protein
LHTFVGGCDGLQQGASVGGGNSLTTGTVGCGAGGGVYAGAVARGVAFGCELALGVATIGRVVVVVAAGTVGGLVVVVGRVVVEMGAIVVVVLSVLLPPLEHAAASNIKPQTTNAPARTRIGRTVTGGT